MRDDIDFTFEYAERLSGPVPDYLQEVERQTFLKTMAPQMLSGRLQGRILALLSKLSSPKNALEIGTFTGYSALCLAEGLAPGGRLHTIEGNPETAFWARKHFAESPYAKNIQLYVGQAKDLLPEIPGPFDLIFLDGDKRGLSGLLSPLRGSATSGRFTAGRQCPLGRPHQQTRRPGPRPHRPPPIQ
jgi:caffeoyl-CoA O-methyltransferase